MENCRLFGVMRSGRHVVVQQLPALIVEMVKDSCCFESKGDINNRSNIHLSS